jgi:hypothetical protein
MARPASAQTSGQKEMQRDLTKAIIGIGGGLILATIAATGMYLDSQWHFPFLWFPIILLAWPCVAWGSFHFARYRGYEGAAGCGLFALGMPIYLFLVHRSHKTLVYVLGFAFVAALPLAVLLALPQKAKRPGRYKRRK